MRLADQVADILLDAILDGRFAAGDTLPPERELAADLDVNRTSLRQAIARLEQMGVVESRQGRGTVIRDVATATDPALIAQLVARDQRAMLIELFEVREALAGLVGRLAAARATAADRRSLGAALADVQLAVSARERQERELAFFRRLVGTTRNRALVALQQWVDAAYGSSAELFTAAFEDGAAVTSGLEVIVAAVESRDPGAADETMTAYARASGARFLAVAAGTSRARTAGSGRR